MGSNNKSETSSPVKSEYTAAEEAPKVDSPVAEKKSEFTNSETAKKYKMVGDGWNRRVNIPGVYAGHIKDIHPQAAEALIKQGRKDIVLKESSLPAGAAK